MAQTFKETAHLKTNLEKYAENYEHIFGKKEEKKEDSEKIARKSLIHNTVSSNEIEIEGSI